MRKLFSNLRFMLLPLVVFFAAAFLFDAMAWAAEVAAPAAGKLIVPAGIDAIAAAAVAFAVNFFLKNHVSWFPNSVLPLVSMLTPLILGYAGDFIAGLQFGNPVTMALAGGAAVAFHQQARILKEG